MPITDRMTPPCCPARAVAAVIPAAAHCGRSVRSTPPGTRDTYAPPGRFTPEGENSTNFHRRRHLGEHVPFSTATADTAHRASRAVASAITPRSTWGKPGTRPEETLWRRQPVRPAGAERSGSRTLGHACPERQRRTIRRPAGRRLADPGAGRDGNAREPGKAPASRLSTFPQPRLSTVMRAPEQRLCSNPPHTYAQIVILAAAKARKSA